MSIKKLIVSAAAIASLVGGLAATASAAYGTQPGFEVSNSHTECAGHGAFGAFGEHGDVVHDFRGGADGQATGDNNSSLCGNPQNN
jgi:hypothetical protein